jgi:hypothetical protein
MPTNIATIPDKPRRGCGLHVAVGCLCLLLADGEVSGSSLNKHNLVSAPYPASYTTSTIAKLGRKISAPTRKDIPQVTPQQVTAVAVVPAEKGIPSLHHELCRAAKPEDSPVIVDALVGSDDSANSRTNIRIGYGRMVADNSDVVGRRNGTRLEEPGCFYVKTTLHF